MILVPYLVFQSFQRCAEPVPVSLKLSLVCIKEQLCVLFSSEFFPFFPPKKRFARFLFRIFPFFSRESKMHFQVVNCPSQVCYSYCYHWVVAVGFVFVFVSLCLSLSLSLLISFKDERIESKTELEMLPLWRSRKFSLLNQLMCVLHVTLNITGFGPNKLRVRLPIGVLRKMYQQSVHRAERHRPLRETARQHSTRANWLKRSAEETLAREHRGRDSSAPIPNTRHVDQWW